MSLDAGSVRGSIEIDDKFSSVYSAFQASTAQIVKALTDLVDKVDALHTPVTKHKTDIELAAEAERKAAIEANAVTESYRKLAAQLSPTTAGVNKYENAQRTLDAALAHGVITHHQYESALDSAKEKFLAAGGGLTQFQSLLGKLTELTGQAGPAAREAAEKLGLLGEKAASITELVESLGPLAPVLLSIAAAIAVIGIAWKGLELGYEFLKESIDEGSKFEEVVAKLNNTLKANGSASGYSASQLVQLADKMSAASAQPTVEILKGIATLTQFQKIGHDTFARATKDILDFAQQTGTAPSEAFEKFGRALEGGQRGLRALEEVGGVFLQGQKATLREMLNNGEIVKYQTTLLSILEEHIRGAADAYAQTFNGQVKNAGNALKDLKEGIASEVLPVFERLISNLVTQMGGWENLRAFIKYSGGEIGNAIRQMVGWIYISYEGWKASQDELEAFIARSLFRIVNFMASGLVSITSAIGKLPAPGAEAWTAAASAINSANVSISTYLIKRADDAQQAADVEHAAATAMKMSLDEHKKALEGDEEVQSKHKSTLDEVANKAKDLSSIYQSLAKDIQAYNDKVSDIIAKLLAQSVAENSLLSAIARGQIAYNIEKQNQADLAAIEATTTQLLQAHREEINKLTDAKQKFLDKKDSAGAAKAQADIDAANKAYITQVDLLGKDAVANVKLKQAIADKEVVLKEDLTNQTNYNKIVATLYDAITNTTKASRENATQTDITAEIVKRSISVTTANTVAEFGLITKILDEVSARHAQTDAINDAITAAKSYNSLANAASFQIAVSNIDSSASVSIQHLEEKYLAFLRDLGKGSIEEGKTVIDQANATFEALGVGLRITEQGIKDNLQALQDAATVSKYKNADKSIYTQYADERADIERLMSASVDKVHLTVAQGQAALEKLESDHWNTVINSWSGALDTLGSVVGGFVAQLAQAAKTLQSAQSVNSGVSSGVSSLGGSSALAGGLGMVAAEVYIVYAIKDYFESKWAEEATRAFGSVGEFVIIHGERAITQLDANGANTIHAIQQVADNFANALGGVFTDIAKIGIEVRNDGKAFAVYVQDVFLGYFTSAQDAVKAALLAALQDPATKIKGLADLVVTGMRDWLGSAVDDYDALMAQLKKLKEISDIGKSSNQLGLEALVYHVNDLWTALTKLSEATPAVAKGFLDLANEVVSGFSDWRRAITGDKQSPEELLAAKRAEGEMFNAQKALTIADIELKKIDLKSQEDYLKAHNSLVKGNAAVNNEGIHIAKAYDQAMAQSVKTQGELLKAKIGIDVSGTKAMIGIYDAQIKIIDDELAALDKELEALGNIPDIDLSKLTIDILGTGTAAGKSADQTKALNDELLGLTYTGMPSVVKGIVDLGTQLADLTDRTKKLHGSEMLLAQARQALIDQAKTQITDSIKQYAPVSQGGTLGSTNWQTQSAGINKTFDDAVSANRKLLQETGQRAITFWQLQADRIAALSVAAEDEITSLGLPAEATRKKIYDLSKSLGDLWAEFVHGAISGDRLKQVIAEISDQSSTEVLSMAQSLLSAMGQTAEAAKVKKALDTANFLLQVYQLNTLYKGWLALGVISDGTKKIMDEALAIINDPKNMPSFDGTSSNGTGPNPANALADAANQQSNASNTLQSAADALANAVRSLADYGKSLLTNSTLSALTPADQLSQARAQLLADYSLAESGDTGAVSAYQGLANTFLQLAKSQDISNASYGVDFQMVLDEINSITSLTGLTSLPGVNGLPNPGVVGLGGASGSTAGGSSGSGATTLAINLDPVVRSISSSSDRNHEDLSTVAARVNSLSLSIQAQQASLDRLASYYGGPH